MTIMEENKYTRRAREATGESRLEYELRRKRVWMDRAQILLWMFVASFVVNIYLIIRLLSK